MNTWSNEPDMKKKGIIVKSLPLLLCAVFALAMFSSCGDGGKSPLNGEPQPREDTGYDAADTGSRQITLKIWHIWVTDSESNKRPFEKALNNWNNSNPDTRLEAEATENETYKMKIRTAVAVNEAPDIFYCWGAGFAKPFVESGKVLCLDDYLSDEILEKLMPGSLEYFRYDGKTYALPIFMIAGVLYCNKELFQSCRIETPDTFGQLLEAVETFKQNGIIPMTFGGKDRWPGMFYQNILAIRTAGVKLCNQALNKQASFNRQEFVESAARLDELIKKGAFDSRCLMLTRDEAEADFKNGKVAMYYNGNWVAGSLERDDSPVKGKIAVKNFPSVENSSGDPNGFLGGAIDTFMINCGTRYKSEAVRALIAITEDFCRESYLAGASQPAWKTNVDEIALNPLTAEISRLLQKSTGFVLAWDTFLEGSEAEIHKNLVTDIFAGKCSPEEFAEKMQELNEK